MIDELMKRQPSTLPSDSYPDTSISSNIKEGYYNTLIYLGNFWGGVQAYLKGMLPLASRGVPAKDRQSRSKVLLASSKLNRLNNDPNYWALQQQAQNVSSDFTNPLPQDVPRGAGRYSGGGDSEMDNYIFNTGRRMVRREDTEHGYVGFGPAEYSENQRDVFAYQSGQYQDNTGGRPRGFFGEEEAEYADDVAALNAVNNTALTERGLPGAEQGTLASKVAPGGMPSMTSSQNADGSYDIRVQRQKNDEAQKRALEENTFEPFPAPGIKAKEVKLALPTRGEEDAGMPTEEVIAPLPTGKKGKTVNLSLPMGEKEEKGKTVNISLPTGEKGKTVSLSLPKEEATKPLDFVPSSVKKVVAPPGSCPPFYGGKKYTAKDVPKDADGLMKFIGGLHKKHKGYSQAVYAKKDMNVANVRRNTMKKLKGAGLM
jgi:hypothetical protein